MKYTKTTLFIIEDEAKEVEGYAFKYTLTDGTEVTMGVYNDGSKWVVIDPTCGAVFCTGLSRRKAVERATNKTHRKALADLRGTEEYAALVEKYESLKTFVAAVEVAQDVTLETVREWCKDKGLEAKQKRDGCAIWVIGKTKPYKEELKAMGFARGTSKRFGKGYYIRMA